MLLTDRFRSALSYAFDLHRTQERKGSGVPYVAHLLGVSSLVLEYGGDEDCAIAGLLHDAAEDQGGEPRIREIQSAFGEYVAGIVYECTDSLESPKPPWKQRKERYLERLAKASIPGQLVSVSDKLYNARAIVADYRTSGESLWSRFTAGRDGVLWYYDALASAYTVDNPIVAEFQRIVTELESLTSRQ